VLTSGTHQDKLAALTLLIRESPLHSVKELGRLRGMTGYKEDSAAAEGRVGAGAGGNKDQRVAVCKALVDWWVSGGGKASGKLR
jgi:ribosome biogenesis protein MAK21